VGPAASSRIVALDQFRGYTVAGMILVNYLGRFALTDPVLKHHNTYFSYADTIMPAFHVAVGFALRLTLLRRIVSEGRRAAYGHVVRRCLGLILLSTVLEYGLSGGRFKSWTELEQTGFWGVLAGPLKNEFWETLAIIGVTSLWVLPVIAAGATLRIAFMAVCVALHVLLAHLFYFDFLYARPNALDALWGATNVRGLDGGPLGFLAWSVPQLVGSLAYDACARRGSPDPAGRVVVRLVAWSVLLMGVGYGLSCLSTVYPRTEPPTTEEGKMVVADSPVVLPVNLTEDPGVSLAEAPFVQPSADQQRQLNYWLMCKRAVTLPFNLFATGFSLGVFALFVLVSDLGRWEVGWFRTLGRNALAAYVIHELVGQAVGSFAPGDAPLWWVAVTFASYAGVTYLFVRHLEKNGIYLRL
jgi:predicted acyltransferase